jgi:hypothetical protein
MPCPVTAASISEFASVKAQGSRQTSWRFGRGVTSTAELLVVRERDNALGLGAMAGEIPADRGPAITAAIPWLYSFAPTVLRRLAGYEDVSDADCLVHDSAMRWVLAA